MDMVVIFQCIFCMAMGSPIQFITSGAGSKAWRDVFVPNSDELKFFYDGQGFMSMQITESRVIFAFYDIHGNVLYKSNLNKQLRAFE